jgi:hypothetical protein
MKPEKIFIAALLSFLFFQATISVRTAGAAALTPSSAAVLTGASQPVVFSASNDQTFSFKTYYAAFSYTSGLSVSDLVTSPAAASTTIDTRKNLIIVEWSSVGPGATLSASFNVSSSSQGTYTLSPSDIHYIDYSRQTYTVSCNISSISFRYELTPPSAPRNVRSLAGDGYIRIYWDWPADNDVTGYKIYRRTATTEFVNIGTTSASPYDDTTVLDGTKYLYEIAAIDYSGNESELSAETSETYIKLLVQTYAAAVTSVAAVGDLNGDGMPDVALGYPTYDAGKGGNVATDVGKVEIYYGNNATGTPDITLTGENAKDKFGYAVAVVDMNNDGYDDLVVGAPFFDTYVTSPYDGTAIDAGRIYVYAGGPSLNSTPIFTWDGTASIGCGGSCYYMFASENLGTSIAVAGDVNNDGYYDVVIGAPMGGIDRSGSIRVLSGGPNLAFPGGKKISGQTMSDYMGYSVASAGDVNGDGNADIIAGGSESFGKAILIYGGSQLSIAAKLQTGIQNDGFGRIVSSAGDINGDGYADFIVNRNIYYGGPTADAIVDRMLPSLPDFLTPLGDVDKDGIADILVSPGPVAYFGGVSEEYVPDILREGITILATADVDRDGIKEIALGTDQSSVYLYSLAPYLSLNLSSISIAAPRNNLTTDMSQVSISGSVTGSVTSVRIGGQSVMLQPDSTFTATVDLTEGTNTIEIIAETAEGKISKRWVTIKRSQSTPLTLSITSPADGATYYSDTPIMVSGTVSDPSAAITINEIPASLYSTGLGNYFGIADLHLTEGTNTITAEARDDFGQTATHSITVLLLTEGMVTGTVTDATTLQPLSGVAVTVQDTQGSQTTSTDAAGNYTVTGVSAGAFTVTFAKSGYFTQTASGTSANGQIQTIDAQMASWPPLTITITSPQAGVSLNTSQVTVTGTVSNNATVTVNNVPATVSTGTFTSTISLPDGVNTITASAYDEYGQTASHGISVTILTKGTISGTVTDSASGIGIASATITIIDSLSTTLTAETDADGNYTLPNVTQGSFTGTITGQDYGTVSFSGSIVAGETRPVNGSIALQAPTVSAPAVSGISLDSATITWTTDQAGDSLITYGTGTSYGSTAYDAVLTKTHSMTLTGLASRTTYHFQVASANSHSLSSSSADNAFATASELIISNLLVSGMTETTAVITWTTDQVSSSQVDFGTTASFGSTVSDPSLTKTHSITLSGLSERTQYYFRVTSVTADGITAQTTDKTFWTRSSLFTAVSLGDYGNVTVMEVTGNYDANNADGSTNSVPRQEIAKEFFRDHQDDYDFLVIVPNFNYAMPEANAFYLEVKNDIQGIGKTVLDNSAAFGSNSKLQGTIDMGNIANLGLDPLDPAAFEQTLDIFAHEQLHRWGAGVKFKQTDGTLSTGLYGKDNTHWSYLLDTDGSLEYGNDWKDNGDGTFTSVSASKYYSLLDLYLMGMIDKSQVPDMTLIENTSIDPALLPSIGTTITGTVRTVTIDDIIAAEGERTPTATDAQKTFKTAFILITQPGTFAGNETAGMETLRNAWAGRFAALTGGRGSIADVNQSLTLTITSPIDGNTINRPDATVSGTIINSTGNETGVTVNGIPVTVYGNQFTADHVSLTEGSNTITATATDTAGNTTTSTITLTAATTGNYITATSNIESGTGPLEATLRVGGTFSITDTSITASGSASPDITAISADEYRVKMKAEGTYTFTISAAGPDGNTCQDTVTITVHNRTQMDNLLKAKWEGMKTKLTSQDVEGAVGFFSSFSQDRYREIFTALSSYLPAIVQNMQDIQLIYLYNGISKYRIGKNETYGGQSMPITYYIYFIMDDKGRWVIDKF